MTHGDELRRALRGGDPGETRDRERVSLRVLGQRFQHLRGHRHEGAGLGYALSRCFGGDVYHAGASRAVVVGELLLHCAISNTLTISPVASDSRSGGTTR